MFNVLVQLIRNTAFGLALMLGLLAGGYVFRMASGIDESKLPMEDLGLACVIGGLGIGIALTIFGWPGRNSGSQ